MKRNVLTVLTVFVVVCFFTVSALAQNTLSEGFESGGKTSYAAANVTLGSGTVGIWMRL